MYQAKVKGTYYEMGYEQGKMIKEKILPQIWFDSFHEIVPAGRLKFANQCEELVRHHMPGFLDELHGVADGADTDYEKVKVWPLCSYARLGSQSCSAVAISGKHTSEGTPLFIRNYDYMDSDREYLTAFWTELKNGHASLGFSDSLSSRYCGFNEKGLAIAASIGGYAGQPQPGLVFSLVTRWVLDQYSTTSEAVEFLTGVPHFHGWNFLLCDIRSNIARVEVCPERVEVINFDEGIGISTNHYLSKEMRKFEEQNWVLEGSTMKRYKNVLQWFQSRNEPVSTDYARRLASSRPSEGGLCDRFTGVEGGTLWSWIHTLGGTTALVSDGPPCENDYQALPTHFRFDK
ncbi:MAG: hypothetical protein JSV85_06755 [Candidatus Bathyarchaeota archaeon]|nr:MAG: hypothetical protein JSV85_06755 [Candidatus Bathyarchaeota archaeon]